MSEQLKQNNDFKNEYLGEWNVYNIGATTIKNLYEEKIINKHFKRY